jgi:NAD(P)-dependent dehydrogenase (short-subunit alcohol dehydrogenase family)
VLNIVTTYAWTGSAFVLPSACAKAGVLALTRSLAVEWARHRIRLNAIAPGPIPTEGAFSRLLPAEELLDRRRARIPAGRFGAPEELAELAAFLVSDASDWIRGEVVTLDGGEWLYGAGEFNEFLELPREQLEALRRDAKR